MKKRITQIDRLNHFHWVVIGTLTGAVIAFLIICLALAFLSWIL